MVFDSICRMRSRVTPYTLPISSRVLGCPSVRPNRIDTTPASRSERVASTECSCSCSSVKLAASPGWMASEFSIRSPNSLSPSSPSGVCKEIGSRPYLCTSMTFSGVMSSSAASSWGVGSRPRSCSICRCTQASLLTASTMCTGRRIVRDCSAIARVIAWRIHQVVLGRPAIFGDPLKVDALTGTQHPPAFGEPLLGEQARLDPLGQLDLLPSVEQPHLPDLLEVVLDRVGRSAGGRHLGGGQALVVIAGNHRLALALLARRLRRAAGSRRGASLAGAWLPLTGRLLPGDGLILGRA